MLMRGSVSPVALIGVLCATLNGVRALDGTKYPDWKGQWVRADSAEIAPWDSRKPWGLGQQPPLTLEYQAVFETSSTLRRVFTDGRAWPKALELSDAGFSIGRWEDTDRHGRFDTLAIETRWIVGPHSYDDSGIPLHTDEQAVIKERISLDERDPGLLHNEITTFDNALSKPWSVTQSYQRAGCVRAHMDRAHPQRGWPDHPHRRGGLCAERRSADASAQGPAASGFAIHLKELRQMPDSLFKQYRMADAERLIELKRRGS